MEIIVLISLYILAIGLMTFGFVIEKRFSISLIGALLLLCSGAILYFDGYDSKIYCTDSNDPTSCSENVNFTYDVNENVTQASTQIIKMNHMVSGFSNAIGLASFAMALFSVLLALMGFISSR